MFNVDIIIQNVGCDGMLDGGTPDVCRVCKGNGSTCRRVKKRIKRQRIPYGK